MARKHTGTAGPLGLIAFGFTACLMMLSFLYPKPSGTMLPLAFVFGGVILLIAAIIEIYREDVFHGTVFGSYGCFWLAVSLGCIGSIYFCGWGLLTVGFMIIALRKNIGSILLFASAANALFLLAAGVGLNRVNADLVGAGAWSLFVCGCICIYAAFGTLIHETYGFLMPLLAPMPVWFPLCCWPHPARDERKVRSIFGLRFTPSEQAYYAGSPQGSPLPVYSSGTGTPVSGGPGPVVPSGPATPVAPAAAAAPAGPAAAGAVPEGAAIV